MAELTDRPFPPGSYPVIVVGSGPGGLQVSYSLSRYGIDHAVLSADEAPGGMFRRWPFFQRLLSWTKPYAPVPHDHPAYQRYDWNSLLADEPENQAIMPGLMDGYSYFPSRPEMQQNLETFASRTGIAIRHGCRWTGTRREPTAGGGEEFVVETSDGEYRAPIVILAVGVAEPAVPETPGIELATHYAGTRRPRRTPTGESSSSASRTPGSSWRRGCSSGPGRSRWRRPRRRSSRSTRSRSSVSGRATSSRSRTTSWAGA